MIYCVEDDTSIRELMLYALRASGFAAEGFPDSAGLFSAISQAEPSLILLDIMLPGIDGYEVCRRVRAKGQTPIIMLSAKGEVFDKVLGLELGADDYMEKPFDAKELVARVKAVLRRFQPAETKETASKKDEKIVEYPDLSINLTNYSVIYQGKRVVMPPKELELLYYLASNPNRVFEREQLLDVIWGFSYIGDTRTVDVHIKRIRQKIHDNEHWRIATIWGVGYKFEVTDV